MLKEEYKNYSKKRVRVYCKDGKSYIGIAWDIIFGDDKSEEEEDYMVDSLVLETDNGLLEIYDTDIERFEEIKS